MFRLSTLKQSWDRFWYSSSPTAVLDFFRIGLGGFWLTQLFLSLPNWDRFYAPISLAPPDSRSLSWLALSHHPSAHWWLWWATVLVALSFTVGFWTRASNILLWVLLSGLHFRNIDLLNGQDMLGYQLVFLAIFAPLGGHLSVDRVLRGKALPDQEVWGWRLLQISVMAKYAFSGPGKWLDCPSWLDGTALYWVALSERWFRYPDLLGEWAIWISPVLTYYTLAVEHLVPLLIWFPRCRLWCLLGAYSLHLPMLFLMSPAVHLYQVIMLVGLTLFWPPEWGARLVDRVQFRTAMRRPREANTAGVRAVSFLLAFLALGALVGCSENKDAPKEATFTSAEFGGPMDHSGGEGRVRRVRLERWRTSEAVWLTGFSNQASSPELNHAVGISSLRLEEATWQREQFGPQHHYAENLLFMCRGPDVPLNLPSGYGVPVIPGAMHLLQDRRGGAAQVRFTVRTTIHFVSDPQEPLRDVVPVLLRVAPQASNPPPDRTTLGRTSLSPDSLPKPGPGPYVQTRSGEVVTLRWEEDGANETLTSEVTDLIRARLPGTVVLAYPVYEGELEKLWLTREVDGKTQELLSFSSPFEPLGRFLELPPLDGGRYFLSCRFRPGYSGLAQASLLLYMEPESER